MGGSYSSGWDELQEPETFLVSDEIREAVDSILSSTAASEQLSSAPFVARVVSADDTLELTLVRLSQSHGELLIVGTCSPEGATKAVSRDASGWTGVEVLRRGETVRAFSLSQGHPAVSMECTPGGDTCTVALSSKRPPTRQKRVL